MIKRQASAQLTQLARQFKAVAVVGPRQSGKTTLVRSLFADKPYVSLENPDTRLFATEDPRGFLAQYADGAILDEAQRTPALFSYLQQVLDETNTPGQFIITGSNNFLLQNSIHQSLAGRVAYLFLLPFSLNELAEAQPKNLNQLLFKGFYPPLYEREMDIQTWHANYIRTYVERDVRLIKGISDLYAFERFIRLAAGRAAQMLNLSNMSVEVGVDGKTIQSWISILESSFIAFRLQPHHVNYNKRLVKMPKLYFYDTGLLCALMGIRSVEQLEYHPLRGEIFENFVVAELLKQRFNAGKPANLFFWRSHKGQEVDVLLERNNAVLPVEIKSGATVQNAMLSNLEYYMRVAGVQNGCLVFGGKQGQQRSSGIVVVPYTEIGNLNG